MRLIHADDIPALDGTGITIETIYAERLITINGNSYRGRCGFITADTIVALAIPVPVLLPVPPETYTRYGILCCRRCNYAKIYCNCIPTPLEKQPADGGESDLKQRILDCKGK